MRSYVRIFIFACVDLREESSHGKLYLFGSLAVTKKSVLSWDKNEQRLTCFDPLTSKSSQQPSKGSTLCIRKTF